VLSADGTGLSVEQCLAQFDVVFREIEEISNDTCSGDDSCECIEAGAARAPSHQAWLSVARACLKDHPDNPTLAELYPLLDQMLALEKEYYDSWDDFMTENLGENWSCDM